MSGGGTGALFQISDVGTGSVEELIIDNGIKVILLVIQLILIMMVLLVQMRKRLC